MSAESLAQRAGLDRHDLRCLARADALAGLAGHRRAALWTTQGIESPPPLGLEIAPDDAPAPVRPLSEGEEVTGDYAHLGLTLRRHPLAILRPQLEQRRLATAGQVADSRHGQWIRAAGLVTCRQRPSTASGVLFVTLEDETGYVNLVVWSDLVEKNRATILRSRLLAVAGKVQREGLVVHVLAQRFRDLTPMLGELRTQSHDFH